MESVNAAKNNTCYDCQKAIELDGLEVKNGFILKYNIGNEDIEIFKCKECYEKNPSLRNFRKCEVYSRVVGYLRPVSQWNKGKKEEYGDRLEFLNP